MDQIKIGKTFKMTRKIGEGSFAKIFHAINLKNNIEVAIKIENSTTKCPQLLFEAKLMHQLIQDQNPNEIGFPNIYWCSTEGEFNILVMDLLGPSLEDLFNYCNRKFSVRTVIQLFEQIITRLEYVHNKGFVHRDVKPDNFLIGLNKYSQKVYLVDFGLAKKYLDKEQTHIPFSENKKFIGTPRFASLNTHLSYEQSRRDDLESLGYILIYFLKSTLPWQNLKPSSKKDKYEKINEKKSTTTVEQLCKGIPAEFCTYLTYVRSLKFDEKPDYQYCKDLFKDLKQQLQIKNEIHFDWNQSIDKKIFTDQSMLSLEK